MLNRNRKNTISANCIKKLAKKMQENLVKWALISFYEWWINIMQYVFPPRPPLSPPKQLKKKKMASVYTWGHDIYIYIFFFFKDICHPTRSRRPNALSLRLSH